MAPAQPNIKLGLALSNSRFSDRLVYLLDDPAKNTEDYLKKRTQEIGSEVTGQEEVKDFNPPRKQYFIKPKQ